MVWESDPVVSQACQKPVHFGSMLCNKLQFHCIVAKYIIIVHIQNCLACFCSLTINHFESCQQNFKLTNIKFEVNILHWCFLKWKVLVVA